jgi:flagellar basal-body rod protein FlgF
VIYGLYQSAAGMLVNQYRQDVTANNLANVDTTGYKRDVASFSQRLAEARSHSGAARNPLLDGMSGGVWANRSATDFSAGTADVTGNPLDAMIAGQGFFAVQTPDGTRYTRAGQFTIDSQGRLVTAGEGFPVLSEQGAVIDVPGDTRSLRLTADGKVEVNNQPVASLQVVDFDDPSKIKKVGKNLVTGDTQPQPIQAQLRVGAIERSNVEPMSELVSMIEASRAYQLNAQMISLQDASLGRAVNELAKPV